jgi:hypothetical protein
MYVYVHSHTHTHTQLTHSHTHTHTHTHQVSFDNGETYTSTGKYYTYYQEPQITRIQPACRLVSGQAIHYLYGPGLEGAGIFTKVRVCC